MKKRSGILALIVSIGLLVQPLSAMTIAGSINKQIRELEQAILMIIVSPLIIYGAAAGLVVSVAGVQLVGMGVKKGVEMGVEYAGGPTAALTYAGIAGGMAIVYTMISNYVAENKAANEKLSKAAVDYTTDRNKLLLSAFPEKIEDRIDELLDQKFEDNGKSIPIFPTPESKIFVLQNIEDFFEFKKGPDYINLNQFVHEACMKKINQIKLVEKDMDEETKKFAQEIDTARKKYMNQYGISVATLKNMSSAAIEAKIQDVQKAINSLVLDVAKTDTAFDKEKNEQFLALMSILVHLFYKQSQKRRQCLWVKSLAVKRNKQKQRKQVCNICQRNFFQKINNKKL
jgi:hypothetical protein